MERRSGKKFSLKSGPLKPSGFKQMGSPMKEHNSTHWRTKDISHFDGKAVHPITGRPTKKNGKIDPWEREMYNSHVRNMNNKAKKNRGSGETKDMRHHADQGNENFIFREKHHRANDKWMKKYGFPMYEVLVHDGQSYIQKNKAVSSGDGWVKEASDLQSAGSPAYGSPHSGMDRDEIDFMKNYLEHGDNWKQAAHDKREQEKQQKALEQSYQDDARLKYSGDDGGSRLYTSDEAIGAYNWRDDITEGYSRVFFSGRDDAAKIQALAFNKKLPSQYKQQLLNLARDVENGRQVNISFKDSDIQSNYREWESVIPGDVDEDGNPRKYRTSGGLDRGTISYGFDKTSRGHTDKDLTRMLVGLVSTGNRMPNVAAQKDASDQINNTQNANLNFKPNQDPNRQPLKNATVTTDENGNTIVTPINTPDDVVDNTINEGIEQEENIIDQKIVNGELQKTEVKDPMDSGKDHEPGSFGEAFKNARSGDGFNGVPQAKFFWNGKEYHTRQANETPEEWAEKFAVNLDAVPGAKVGPQPEGSTSPTVGEDGMSIKYDGYSIDTDPDSPTLGQVTPPPSTENNTKTETNTEKVVEDGKVKEKIIPLETRTLDRIPTAYDDAKLPEMNTSVEPIDHRDQDAYGGSGEPQTVDPPVHEPQSTQDNEDDDDKEDDS